MSRCYHSGTMDDAKHINSLESLTLENVRTIARMQHAANMDRTKGEAVADKFASIIGSWKFIIIQSCLLIGWLVLNVVAWVHHWDPYPFILLNLALSFQAAYASPIIMMSQNRQGKLAELRNNLDLQINLLAEQENTETLRLLHQICKHLDIKLDEPMEKALEQHTKPDKIFKEIERYDEDKK
jgi:uncharacterized membrane protein